MSSLAHSQDPDNMRDPDPRLTAIRLIAQELLSLHCKEEGVQLRRLIDLDLVESKQFIEAAAFITAWTLDADRREAALMCMADTLCADGTDRGIEDYPRSVQQHYYHLGISALHTLTENMKDLPPDLHYRDRMCRLVDALFPKTTDKAVWG